MRGKVRLIWDYVNKCNDQRRWINIINLLTGNNSSLIGQRDGEEEYDEFY